MHGTNEREGMLCRISCMLVALALLATGWAFAEAGEDAQLEKDVVVLFTSDVHCGVDQGFGYVGLKAIKDQLEREGCHVLLVDNGDAIQGEPVGLLTQGEAIIDMMNKMGYDIAIPGNHEFDYGVQRFLALAEMAEYPYVSCNFNREGKLVFPPYVIREFDGVKLAFVGVTTPQTLYTSTPRYFQDESGNFIYGFMQGNDGADLYEAVQRAVDDARSEGADYVILLGHLGHDAGAIPYTYADVLGHTTGIDAMLDGHSHDTDKVVMKNRDGREVIRQACGTKLEGIGWMRISAADGSIDTGLYTWNNPVPVPKLLGIQNEMSEAVDSALASLGEWLNTKVGVSTADADHLRSHGSGRFRKARAHRPGIGNQPGRPGHRRLPRSVRRGCGHRLRWEHPHQPSQGRYHHQRPAFGLSLWQPRLHAGDHRPAAPGRAGVGREGCAPRICGLPSGFRPDL